MQGRGTVEVERVPNQPNKNPQCGLLMLEYEIITYQISLQAIFKISLSNLNVTQLVQSAMTAAPENKVTTEIQSKTRSFLDGNALRAMFVNIYIYSSHRNSQVKMHEHV